MKTTKTYRLLYGIAALFTVVALAWVCFSWLVPEATGNFTKLSSHINAFLYFSDIPAPAFYVPSILCLLLSGFGLITMKKGKLTHYLVFAVPLFLLFGIGFVLMWSEGMLSPLFMACTGIAYLLAISIAFVRPKAV